jgi:AcrR family transcriptional regulator
MTAATAQRRLSAEARREQLVEVALSIAAHEGQEGLTFEAVAKKAGVTRNLVYHYFSGGPNELFRAAVECAGEQLSGEWITDDSIPLPERLAANFRRIADHAAEPTDAWLLHRQGRASVDDEILELADRYYKTLVANIAVNWVGTPKPPAVVRIAIQGFIAFSEDVLDAWRETNVPRAAVERLLAETLAASIASAVASTE